MLPAFPERAFLALGEMPPRLQPHLRLQE